VTHPRIAILGGGILGSCTALELARRGQPVTIIEGATRLLDGASRWNEGKIHLGFLYAADPSLRTATRMIPGGLAFPELVARHIGQSLEAFTTDDDVFLVHRDSVVDADAFAAYADRTAALVREAAAQHGAPRYLGNVCEPVRRLSPSELAGLTTLENVVAGFRAPERSVSTVAVADLLCAAVAAEPRIELRTSTWIDAVRRRDSGRLDVITSALDADGLIGFDVVVNALWEGRLAIDATLSIAPPAPWTHRFRAGVFGHAGETTLSSAVLCTGPFGDVKRYRDGRVYLSWYESGLLAEGHEMEPPRRKAKLSRERGAQVMQGTLDALAKYFPAVVDLAHEADELEVRGGWVYAIGQGSLADRASTLHQRDKFEITIDRGYISVDTAKYSLAPWLAAKVAETIGSLL
jgi:glycine/D-amino acid oxidase-like deaminating enzyme